MEARRAFKYLQLDHFDDKELEDRFHKIVSLSSSSAESEGETEPEVIASRNDDILPMMIPSQLEKYLQKTIQQLESKNGYPSQYDDETTIFFRHEFAKREAQRLWRFLVRNNAGALVGPSGSTDPQQKPPLGIAQDAFVSHLRTKAQAVDIHRLWPLTTSMIMVGATVGVTTPAMPFIVQQLGITTGEYGLVVSAFGLSKMIGNIPFAVLVERYGRKPYLVYSLMVISAGMGGIGLATGFESLYLCRLFTGFGVAALSTAATLTVTDISTPLNRASTFAPIMSGFAAGTAVGPALGGMLVDTVGTTETFYLVGASYIALAGMNSVLLDETRPRTVKLPWQTETVASKEGQPPIRESFQRALGQWIPLLSQTPVRNVCIMNAFYWIALAGSQMTLLPLILTNPVGLNMTATQVGQVYMGMSVVQVFGGPVFAKVVDQVGKAPGIVGGCVLISSSMALLPMCEGIEQMAGVLAMWATGSTLLSTSPLAYVSDQVDDDKRAQAIALLRTSGDVGYLIGASSMGALADWTGSLEMAMQSSSAILLTATGWFTARSIMTAQLAKSTHSQ